LPSVAPHELLAPRDATIVARLRAAGAIILGLPDAELDGPAGVTNVISTDDGQHCLMLVATRNTGGAMHP